MIDLDEESLNRLIIVVEVCGCNLAYEFLHQKLVPAKPSKSIFLSPLISHSFVCTQFTPIRS